MKELTIEEKAKAYDEALAKAVKIHRNYKGRVRAVDVVIEEVFPELKESDDEKIRKDIVTYLTQSANSATLKVNAQKFNKWIAWLEKQGEKKYIEDLTQQEAMDIAVAKFFEQGEQKSIDKVEPKFHEGEWIVNNDNGYVYQVTDIRDDEYCLWPLDAEIMGYLRIIDVDNDYHLWTIQDAKSGDVLVCGKDERPFIFKGLLDKSHPANPVAYCGINYKGLISISSGDGWWWTDEEVRPATKEQRDLLFQKMKEVGYEWDAEKKKLSANWIQELEDKLANATPKQLAEWKEKYFNEETAEWSEEDEQYLLVCKNALAKYQTTDKWDATIISQWLEDKLKSIRPQNRWKPNLAQLNALSIVSKGNVTDDIEAIVSLYNDLKKLMEE